MTRPPRKTLSLLSDDAQEEKRVELNVVDALLPCRLFEIDHKIATLGKVSLTTELLLRLLKSADGMTQESASAFFGFDHREMAFVLSEVESLGYVERRDGQLWITGTGVSLFREGAGAPEIFEVEKRNEKYGFDLITLAPQRAVSLSEFERRLPELPLADAKFAAAGSASVPDAFRKHFLEIARDRERDLGRRSLYSVDQVVPGDRFSSVVRIVVTASNLRPSQMEIDLNTWRPEDEQGDRNAVRIAAASFAHELQTGASASDAEAYGALIGVAPEFLKEFTRRDGLAIDRYFREAVARAGDVRIDRRTVTLVGSLFVRENVRRLVEVLSYGLRDRPPPKCAIWCPPVTPHWGATAALPDLLSELTDRLGGRDEQPFQTVCLTQPSAEQGRLERAFDRVALLSERRTPPALECLVIPNIACAVLAHAPIGAARGYPVGLGVVSFDSEVVARAVTLVVQAAGGLKSGIDDVLELLD